MASSRPQFLRGLLLGAALASVLALAAASPAAAASVVSPNTGPTTGGTTVSLGATTLGFKQIAHGNNNGYALSGDGRVYAWGTNGNHELGNGGTTVSAVPVPISAGAIPVGATIKQIAAGWSSGYALASDGAVYAWGANYAGQLGDDLTDSPSVPVAVDLSAVRPHTTIVSIAAGQSDGYALASNGELYAWGYNNDGELGDGDNSDVSAATPVSRSAMPPGVTFTSVAAGQNAAYAVGSDGKVYAWGSDTSDALGLGVSGDKNVPTAIAAGAIPSGVKMAAVAGGQEGGYALGDDGHVYAWGSDTYGDLGDGHNADSDSPVKVVAGSIPRGVRLVGLSAGSASGYSLGSDGKAYGWGKGGDGQLGAPAADTNVPVALNIGVAPAGVSFSAVSGGYHCVIVLGSDGRVYGSGDNFHGDLGDGTSTPRSGFVLGPNATISDVSFGGVAGTNVIDPPGVTTVVTPPHAVGAVAVVVSGSAVGGTTPGTATTRTIPAAFTYTFALAETGVVFPWWLLWIGCAAIAVGAILVWRRPLIQTLRW